MAAEAFGKPGIPPTWTSSAKDLVITSLGASRLWAAIGHGILNEVYWPATGQPQVRDLGFIVGGEGWWVEVKRVKDYQVHTPAPYVPLPRITHTAAGYRLSLEFLPDPIRDVLLISYLLEGQGVSLYPLLAPHLGMSGWNNTGWVANGLFAQSDRRALCLLCDQPFLRMSAGYVGYSDGWQDFAHHGRMTYTFSRAEEGNVALTGELDRGEGVLALGLAETPEGARTLAAASLAQRYTKVREGFVAGWQAWGNRLRLPSSPADLAREACLSACMVKVHEDRTYPGALVASLSIPWGNHYNDPGGYHLVWPRDAVEAALGLWACGQEEDAQSVLAYLAATQDADGCWFQNFYPDGRPFWRGVQLDEAAFPIILAAALREGGLSEPEAIREMVRRAAACLAQHGPISPQDRWEEDAGASPFTLAVEIAALVAAALYYLEGSDRAYALALADCWNERIEEWTCVQDSKLSRLLGVKEYYVRIGPPWIAGGLRGRVEVRNRPGEVVLATALVGLEFLYLARLGLRRADAPLIGESLKVAESLLGVDTPQGRAYHRYNGDGYGEHADGSAFDGTGIGRAWPLLVGERGHLALLRGEDTLPYLETMARMTGTCGLLPEQVWDVEALPERGLFPGKPTGSAMPLIWAHAEFLKLLIARDRGHPIERLDAVWERYRGCPPAASTWFWRQEIPFLTLPAARSLVIEARQPFLVHLGFDGWQEIEDRQSVPLGLGMHGVRLDPGEMAGHHELDFAIYFPAEGRWEGEDHMVSLQGD